ncbi:unnamed protein product [Didymodactylos carnosus]|uniref:Akirin n=1 Tax=Didymodactylos carnosus TaxID=1234261 RepID=A0A814YW59_9BILA|nr:unnamed protein product [Didymodactylos carnosus]CAF1244933.1 unnamed protein product [Didymodactylos carnosus]CAF3997731.1 unnamed protein product [Didymodactylos carnosus]CAF4052442.1 unnamed protein product [Didymodactylos carnosus]
MASCLTLKRPLEHVDHPTARTPSPVSKRRRCVPMTIIQSPDSNGCNVNFDSNMYSDITNQSSFPDVEPVISSDALLERIKDEIKRLHRRHQLQTHVTTQQPSSPSTDLSEEENTGDSVTSMTNTSVNDSFKQQRDRTQTQPLLSLKQVNEICARLLKEHEEKIREEYDRILAMKLNQQYESFVRFTQDQLTRRFSDLQFSCK